MTDYLTLNLKCPVCGKSLMNHEYKVDDYPGVKLNIKVDNTEGIAFLSSIYGSYNCRCNISIPDGKIVKFYCPHCSTELVSNNKCDVCEGPMIPLNLEMGGQVDFCSRKGCNSHEIKFSEFDEILKNIYSQHGFKGRHFPEIPHGEYLAELVGKNDKEKKIIRTGAFLRFYCPHCKKSLIENNKLKLKIKNAENEFLHISPYLNVFSTESTIGIQEDKVVRNTVCPHCGESLLCTNDEKCANCDYPVIKIIAGARSRMIDFYICSHEDCKCHGISQADYDDIMLEDSNEW